MGQILHKRATTTHAVRAEIQRSTSTIKELAERYHLNPKTVLKWKHRSTIEDAPMGPKRVKSVLSEQDEEIICSFRRKTLLPLDDCFINLQELIPQLTRSNLHRCLKRHGLNRLPKQDPESIKKPFKKYPLGYFHVDLCEVRTKEGKAYLFVGIDRTSKYCYAQIHENASVKTACQFLKDLVLAVPYKVHKILTDNGVQFTYRLFKKPPQRIHPFDQVCQTYHIEHRLTQFKHPWTNGQVERMNRTLKEATVKTYHYETLLQLKRHLYDFLKAYNYAKKLKILKFKTPMEKILEHYQKSPELFHANPNHYNMGLNT